MGIGLSLFIAELTGKSFLDCEYSENFRLTIQGVYFTGGSLNPARSFGPAVVNHFFHGYHWIYWVGPVLGAIVASGFYKFIKILEYESANPDQDATEARIQQAKIKEAKEILGLVGSHGNDSDERPLSGSTATEKNTVVENGVSNGTGADIAGSTTMRPGMGQRLSTRQRVDSPAMASVDEAFTGLDGGMHADEFDTKGRPGLGRTVSRIV